MLRELTRHTNLPLGRGVCNVEVDLNVVATNPHNAPALKPPPLAQPSALLLAPPDEDSRNSADSILSQRNQWHHMGTFRRLLMDPRTWLTHISDSTTAQQAPQVCFSNNSAQALTSCEGIRHDARLWATCVPRGAHNVSELLWPFGEPTEAQPLAQRTTRHSTLFFTDRAEPSITYLASYASFVASQ